MASPLELAAIQHRVRTGRYRVDAAKVAVAMIEHGENRLDGHCTDAQAEHMARARAARKSNRKRAMEAVRTHDIGMLPSS